MTTTGRRVEFPESWWFDEGDYARNPVNGYWYARPPGASTCSLAKHHVTEHEDGTITVSPSILVRTSNANGEAVEQFHGWLRRGVWASV